MFCKKKKKISLLILSFIIIFPLLSLAENNSKNIKIKADKLKLNEKTREYFAEGKVFVKKGNNSIEADSVFFNKETMESKAEGNIIYTNGEDIIYASKSLIDFKKNKGSLDNADMHIHKDNYKIKSKKIKKTDEFSYEIKDGSLTTCDGENPNWSITGKQINFTLGEYLISKHTVFWVKSMPVMYFPIFVVPVKLERESGFLIPRIGDSKRKGFIYEQGYFWAIDEANDITFNLHHMNKRGEKIGLEYRYAISANSKGTFAYDFLNDKKIGDETEENKDWSYEKTINRENHKRYWFKSSIVQETPFNSSLKLDLDIVSDPDYLREFQDGNTDFKKSKDYYEKNFSKTIDDYTETNRLNKLVINKNWQQYNFNISSIWYDNVNNKMTNDKDYTLQKPIYLEFDGIKQQIGNTKLFFDLNTEAVNFYRDSKDETKINGSRADALVRFYLPLSYKSYFNFEPSVGIRRTEWWNLSYEDENIETSRNNYDVKLDFNNEFFKIFNLKEKERGIDKVKHSIKPQIIYEYVPEDKKKYPNFDAIDDIKNKELITYSITQTFTTREKTKHQNLYNELLLIKLSQSYDLIEAKKENGKPYSLISLETELKINKYLAFKYDKKWSQYDKETKEETFMANISDKRGDALIFENRYKRDKSDSLYASAILKTIPSIDIVSEYELDKFNDKKLKSAIGLIYRSQCWSIFVRKIDELEDKKIEFIISFYGLGDLGNDFDYTKKISETF